MTELLSRPLSFLCLSVYSMLLANYACAENVSSNVDRVSIQALRTADYNASLTLEDKRYARSEYSGDLYSYQSDGLKVYALVNTPTAPMPARGYPVLIFGHGFHPEPKKYGVTKSGEISRPGDYYRGIPESFAKRGFLVVTPDYRGHNASQGFEFTKTSYLASSYYASDVLGALSGLRSLKKANLNRIYYLGHSMGGDVGLKVLLASDVFKAASLWSPVAATTNEQALYYGKYYDENTAPGDAAVSSDTFKKYTSKVDDLYAQQSKGVSKYVVDPIHHVHELSTPLIVQHARRDESVPYAWAESLVAKLFEAGKEVVFHSYDTSNHLFNDENKAKAILRDIEFFNEHP